MFVKYDFCYFFFTKIVVIKHAYEKKNYMKRNHVYYIRFSYYKKNKKLKLCVWNMTCSNEIVFPTHHLLNFVPFFL